MGDRQADSVHCNRALFDNQWNVILRIADPDLPATVTVAPFNHCADSVHVALHEVSIQSGVDRKGTLHIESVADGKLAEHAAIEGFTDRGELVAQRRGIDVFDGKANAVVGHAFIDAKTGGQLTLHTQNQIVRAPFEGQHLGQAFNDSGEHRVGWRAGRRRVHSAASKAQNRARKG